MQALKSADAEVLAKEATSKGARYVTVVFQDLEGRVRERVFKASALKEALEGFRVDGYSLGLAPIEDSDLIVKPDPFSARVYESELGRALFLVGDLYYGSKPLPTYPRHLLREAVEKLGYEARVGLEVEFYLTRGVEPADKGGYWSPLAGDTARAVSLIVASLEEAGVEVRSLHHEVGPGQYELLPAPMDPVSAADTLLLVKKVAWRAASSLGLSATFMPKPFTGLPGSGLHLHLSLHRSGRNVLFEDASLTEEGLSFIAGLLAHARSTALLTNPTVNSYKRLVPGFEAPVLVAWGVGNRSVLVRVPKGASRTVEYRLPDSSGNAYLAIAAVLLAGVKGVEEKLEPPPQCTANAYSLDGYEKVPRNLGEALQHALESKVLDGVWRGAVEALAAAKAREWKAYLKATGADPLSSEVTSWEIENYFQR